MEMETYCSVYGSWKSLKESWPAAARVELGVRLVQRGSAASAVINPVSFEFVVFSCSG